MSDTIFDAIRQEAAKFKILVADGDLEHVLWAHTGYPCFWSISEENPTPEACLRSQVREWARTVIQGAACGC